MEYFVYQTDPTFVEGRRQNLFGWTGRSAAARCLRTRRCRGVAIFAALPASMLAGRPNVDPAADARFWTFVRDHTQPDERLP
jgi:hypothetical protein